MKIRMEQKGIDHAIIQRCTPINESDKEKKSSMNSCKPN